MKVFVTMREIQYFESTEEIEMTPFEFATYCNTGSLPAKKEFDVKCEFDQSGIIQDCGHRITEQTIINIEKN
jgi:hypothetical protein